MEKSSYALPQVHRASGQRDKLKVASDDRMSEHMEDHRPAGWEGLQDTEMPEEIRTASFLNM